MNLQFLSLLTLSTLLLSCSQKRTFSDDFELSNSEKILRIEFKKPSQNLCNSSFEEFSVENKNQIAEFIKSLNDAPVNGPWKGACWIEIHIETKNKNQILKSNQKVFSWKNSGTFYSFPDNNYINQLRKLNEISTSNSNALTRELSDANSSKKKDTLIQNDNIIKQQEPFNLDYIKVRTTEIKDSINPNFQTLQTGIDINFISKYISPQKVKIGYPEYLPSDYGKSYSFEGFKEFEHFNLMTITHTNETCCNTLYLISLKKYSITVINIATIGFYGGDGGWHGQECGTWVNDSTIRTIVASEYDDDIDETTNNSEIDSTWFEYQISKDGLISQLKLDSVKYIGNQKII